MYKEMDSTKVVGIVFSSNAKKEIEFLAAKMPIWVVASEENEAAVSQARLKFPWALTVFFEIEGESQMDKCSRILLEVDEHHDVEVLEIFGVDSSDLDPAVLCELQVKSILNTGHSVRLLR